MDPANIPSSSTGGVVNMKLPQEEEEIITGTTASIPSSSTGGKLPQEEEIISETTMARWPPPNLPCGDLIGPTFDFINICVPLHNASTRGDWKAARYILDTRPELQLVRYGITENYDTALHIAASAKSNKSVEKFVENLVDLMTNQDLELQNKKHNTALCLAAAAGNVKIAMIMVNRHRALLDIQGYQGMMPLNMASLFGHRDMVKYLFDNSKMLDSSDSWTHTNRGWAFQTCVEADLFDIALKIADYYRQLAASRIVLGILARKTDSFRPSDAMKLLRIVWAKILKLPKAEIAMIMRGPPGEKQDGVQKYSARVLFVATEMGNTEFVVELVSQYPDLIWQINDDYQTIFHVAVTHRHEGIYNLLHEIGSMKDTVTALRDKDGNNMLHLVGKNAKKRLGDVSGYALQMQRELLWFKEVEAMLPPSYRERKNKDGLTPHELFTIEHKDLVSAGEKWMKDTASQCMVVAALIATIVFAAAFTIPGGYDQTSGLPMFLHRKSFILFVISDAIALTFASISILIFFLSILTSCYAEQEFLEKLPKRLMRGLTTLFFSIATMMVAFSVSFFVLYRDNFIWVPIVITIFASIPVILYARLQYDLLGDVYHSTYGSKNLFKPQELKLFLQNPKENRYPSRPKPNFILHTSFTADRPEFNRRRRHPASPSAVPRRHHHDPEKKTYV
ncbi:hypothetical protein L6452_38146 [Arctium lappa]|uniref:Uncharacterized protein n=1 Tax=Arctium lappa TaxID=4217 RepID=A0ACB8Y4Y0_ARCLA|nr:hypothetical protein L6452_38146 [Arctium lappa]